MTFPVAPVQNDIMEEDAKTLGVSWLTYHNQMSVQLRTKFSDQGYVFPSVENTILSQIQNTQVQSIVFNGSTDRMNVNNTGSYEEIATISKNSTDEIQNIIDGGQENVIGRIFVDTTANSLVTTLDGSTIVTLQTL